MWAEAFLSSLILPLGLFHLIYPFLGCSVNLLTFTCPVSQTICRKTGSKNQCHSRWNGIGVLWEMRSFCSTKFVLNWILWGLHFAFFERVIVGHPIREGTLKYFNLLNNFNIGFTLITAYMLSFLSILAVSFLLGDLSQRIRFTGRRKRLEIYKRIALTLYNLLFQRISVGIFIFGLFVGEFIWFTQLFLSNNIKVEVWISLCFIDYW